MVDDPAAPGDTPDDAEQWTDEQWIAWLDATDEDPLITDTRPSTRVGRITHSAGGSVLGQAMLATAQAIYGRKDDDVAIVVEGSSEPGDDQPFRVYLDPEYPERSAVVFPAEVRPPVSPATSDHRRTPHDAAPERGGPARRG